MREAKGSERDFKACKDTVEKLAHKSIGIDADLGYLGIERPHPDSRIPVKSSKDTIIIFLIVSRQYCEYLTFELYVKSRIAFKTSNEILLSIAWSRAVALLADSD